MDKGLLGLFTKLSWSYLFLTEEGPNERSFVYPLSIYILLWTIFLIFDSAIWSYYRFLGVIIQGFKWEGIIGCTVGLLIK